MNRFDNLNKFQHDAWHLLIKAAIQRKGSYQTPTVATIGPGGNARQRVVVLREADKPNRRLTLFTDARSDKVAELKERPTLSWLFWDERKKVQIRMESQAILERGTDRCRAYWDKLPVQGRKSYAALQAPGTPQESDTETLPPFWNADMPLEDTAYAFDNFMVITGAVSFIDCLHLHADGHQRANYTWVGGEWKGQWVTP